MLRKIMHRGLELGQMCPSSILKRYPAEKLARASWVLTSLIVIDNIANEQLSTQSNIEAAEASYQKIVSAHTNR